MFVDMFPLGSKASGLPKHDTGNTKHTDIMNVASAKEIVRPVHIIFLHVHVTPSDAELSVATDLPERTKCESIVVALTLRKLAASLDKLESGNPGALSACQVKMQRQRMSCPSLFSLHRGVVCRKAPCTTLQVTQLF